MQGKYWGSTGQASEGVVTEDYYIYGQLCRVITAIHELFDFEL